MLQQERIGDFEEGIRLALDGFARTLNCAKIGLVESYNAKAGTVVVTLAIQALVTSDNGTQTLETIRPLVDVPVIFLGGGNMVATFPIAQGDEALVIFSDRCIDAWWQSGGVQKPAEPRVHSIHDGFAIVGPRSLARSIPNLSTTTSQLRTLDGSTYFEVASGGEANIVAPNGVNIIGPVNITGNVTLTGAMSATGDVSVTGKVTATAEGTFNGIPVSSHLHGGVQTGGGDTGTPIA
jgi:hypothetical protein